MFPHRRAADRGANRLPMAEIIDIALVADAKRLLEQLIEKHGIAWFLKRDGKRLMAIDDAKVDLVLATAAAARKREHRKTHPSALEHCRVQLKRALIRMVAQAMVASGC